MDPERAKDTPDPDTIVAVAVGRLGNPPRTTHAGLVYRDGDGKLAALHLGWHELLLTDPFDSPYVFAYPEIDPVRASNVAGLCRLIRNQRPKIPYAFRLDLNARFCTRTGDIRTLGEGHGLNCANFVIIVFQSTGISLESVPKGI